MSPEEFTGLHIIVAILVVFIVAILAGLGRITKRIEKLERERPK